MKWLESEAVREMLSRSDFSPLDLNDGKTTVYWVQPPELLGTHQRLLRLMASTFLGAVLKGRKARGKDATLLIFNECYALGRLDLLLKTAALLRGYGARGIYFFQNIGQCRDLYDKNADTFFANSGQVTVLSGNDHDGASFVSMAMGDRWRVRKKKRKDARGNIEVEYEQEIPRPLRDPAELNRLLGRAGRTEIVLNEGGDPLLLRRTSYRKMFTPDQYDRDVYELPRETLGDKVIRWARAAVKKSREQRQ
jgi:type IV secretory pathway TraG/TraD family ATPase VirD4